jgi:hypothetical protein
MSLFVTFLPHFCIFFIHIFELVPLMNMHEIIAVGYFICSDCIHFNNVPKRYVQSFYTCSSQNKTHPRYKTPIFNTLIFNHPILHTNAKIFLYIFYTYFWTCSPNEYAWNYCRWIFIKIHSINKKIVVFLTICNA